ncbi:hypothetical protein GCM10007148_08900 [Parvularcula lutaonensis]|nr:hypothetical protein GCM10007148_08900 [Parvularcula lutaonensis]
MPHPSPWSGPLARFDAGVEPSRPLIRIYSKSDVLASGRGQKGLIIMAKHLDTNEARQGRNRPFQWRVFIISTTAAAAILLAIWLLFLGGSF